jgi:hypothetical protein
MLLEGVDWRQPQRTWEPALEALIAVQQSELSAQQEKLLRRGSEIEHLKLVIPRLRSGYGSSNLEKIFLMIGQLFVENATIPNRRPVILFWYSIP